MGVPKFFRWASQAYPAILSGHIAQDDGTSVPDVDNLYLDMNGIIHRFSHPNSTHVAKQKDINEIIDGICEYVDNLVTVLVRPLQILFIAVDGVAPRAKLNQQRARRFRSADEVRLALKKASDSGHEVAEGLFDSNCISPGTEFMEAISNGLKAFITRRMREHEVWRRLTIYLSGHDVPGEGEHKIVSFIRQQRLLPGYQPNQRHCMNGQDADMIMLALATHEPYFLIIREVLEFGPKAESGPPKFELVRVNLLRECLIKDLLRDIPHDEATLYDPERLVDDFVFMTFFIGNDFLPTIPTLHIGDGAFDHLFDSYRMVLDENYLVEKGVVLNVEKLEYMFQYLSSNENEVLKDRHNKGVMWSRNFNFPVQPKIPVGYPEAIAEAITAGKFPEESVSYLQSTTRPETEPTDYRRIYYFRKFGILIDTPEGYKALTEIVRSYMEGTVWNYAYYSKGCISWSWYYPYHYSPLMSDLIHIAPMFLDGTVMDFSLDRPLLPFMQLLSCLPPASSNFLPSFFRELMNASDSHVLDYYPREIQLDLNDEDKEWKAVVVLPFIETNRLLEEIELRLGGRDLSSLLTDDEKARNQFSHTHVYSVVRSGDEDETLASTHATEESVFNFHASSSSSATTSTTSTSTTVQYYRQGSIVIRKRTEDLIVEGNEHSSFVSALYPGTIEVMDGYPNLSQLPEEEVRRIFNNRSSGGRGGGGGGRGGGKGGRGGGGGRGHQQQEQFIPENQGQIHHHQHKGAHNHAHGH